MPSDPVRPERPQAQGHIRSTPFLGTIAGRVLSLSSAEVLISALSFLVLAYLARVLGPGAFGVIAFATSIVAFFSLFLHEGLNTFGAMPRDISGAGSASPCMRQGTCRSMPLRSATSGPSSGYS